MKINILLADADGRLKEMMPVVGRASQRVEAFMGSKFDFSYGINVVFSSMGLFQIPEDGVGGRTLWCDFVMITIDTTRELNEDILFEMICHEVAHAIRWSRNTERINSLFDGIINEGLATVVEEMAVRENKTNEISFFIETVIGRSAQENEKILSALKPELDNEHYNYDEIFFEGNNVLPRWAGYSLGYYLVKKYLATEKREIWQAIFDDYSSFRKVLVG